MARAWNEWHGGPCPVAKGTLVDVRYRCPILGFADEEFAVPALVEEGGRGGSWLWLVGYVHVTEWRLSEGPSAEAETRAHRENLFRDWLKEAEGLGDGAGYLPGRQPEKAVG